MNSGTGYGNGGSGSQNTLFVKRDAVYVGTPAMGRLYVGADVNGMGRAISGFTMEDFDYNGGFNGDILMGTNNASPTTSALLDWVSAKGAGFYSANKIVYASPQYAGFTFFAGFEPSQSSGEAAISSGGTLNPTTSSIASSQAVRRNTVDFGLRWSGSVGPASLAVGGGMLTAGHPIDTVKTDVPYKTLNIFAIGGRVTYGPFSLGTDINGGQMNAISGGSLLRKGQRNALNAIFGGQYIIGPVIMGFQYVVNTAAGNYNPTTIRNQLHESGVIVGGAWDFAPGASLYGDVFWDRRHQYGWSFLNGTANSGTTAKTLSVGNNIQARCIQIGTVFRW